MGPRWQTFRDRDRLADCPIATLIALVVGWRIWRKATELRREARAHPGD